jgi:hypothetical protein
MSHSHFEVRKSAANSPLTFDFIGGEPNPVPMAKKKPKHDPQWAKTKNVCRLNMDDIRMANGLGMSPQSLGKNKPSPSRPWKQPVKEWIGELYEKRFGRKTSSSGVNDQPTNQANHERQSRPS